MVPDEDKRKGCYIMVGQNVSYEPGLLENHSFKRELDYMNSSDLDVSLSGALAKRSISSMKRASQRSVSRHQESSYLPQRSTKENNSNERQYTTLLDAKIKGNNDYIVRPSSQAEKKGRNSLIRPNMKASSNNRSTERVTQAEEESLSKESA